MRVTNTKLHDVEAACGAIPDKGRVDKMVAGSERTHANPRIVVAPAHA
jgi:hypothetical protein